MSKLIYIFLLSIIISCSTNKISNNGYKSNLNQYEYAKFSSFHEGLFNFTYVLKEMDEVLKKKYLDEYIFGFTVYMELAQELSQLSVDKSLGKVEANSNNLDPISKKILMINANLNHKIQLHQIGILDDEISLESFKYGIRMSKYTGFWEIFEHYFFDYCINFKDQKETFCKDSFNKFVKEYKMIQEKTEIPDNSKI